MKKRENVPGRRGARVYVCVPMTEKIVDDSPHPLAR